MASRQDAVEERLSTLDDKIQALQVIVSTLVMAYVWAYHMYTHAYKEIVWNAWKIPVFQQFSIRKLWNRKNLYALCIE